MALKHPVDSGVESQGWGPSWLGIEPAMYSDGNTAWWNWYSGAKFYNDFHAAIDISAATGTPILASEAGTVTQSYYDGTYGGGNKVRVQIRPGVYYTSNHMNRRAVIVGQHVGRGQLLGEVGSTGASTGPHIHFEVGMDDGVGSQEWPRLFNPHLFLPGGALENDPRIKPIELREYFVLKGAGVNIRTTPDLDVGQANIFATSRADGIYRHATGKKIWRLDKKFEHLGSRSNDDGRWLRTAGYGRQLWVHHDLVTFVNG